MHNIALMTDIYNPSIGGPYTIIKETQKALLKRNFNVKIISISTLKNKKLETILKKYDICHFYGGWTYFHIKSFLVASKLKKKIIIHPLGYFEPWSLSQKKFKKKIAWRLYQEKILLKSNLIHCASSMERNNLLKLNKNFKTKIISYAISDNFIKKKQKKKTLKKKAIFFSRIHKKKGLENLIRAWNTINDKNWSLDIFGPVDDESYLNKLILMNQSSKINFFKAVYKNSEKIRLFEKYDLFILPTSSENFGMVILESLARGLPVLTTHSAPWNAIKVNNAGWIIPNNYSKLINILRKIFITDKNIFCIKSNNAIKLAKKYSWKNVVKIYEDTYKKLLK